MTGTQSAVPIALGNFEALNAGKEITQRVSKVHNLKEGDTISWECGQSHSGSAKVLKVREASGEASTQYHECVLLKS